MSNKCTMCNFRLGYQKREKIQLMNVAGSIFRDNDNTSREELDYLNGELELQKNLVPLAYHIAITVAGTEVNNDFSVVTIARFTTTVCPKCGKILK